MRKAGTELQHSTELLLAREFQRTHQGPIMLKKLQSMQSFSNSWDKDILAHHGFGINACRSSYKLNSLTFVSSIR